MAVACCCLKRDIWQVRHLLPLDAQKIQNAMAGAVDPRKMAGKNSAVKRRMAMRIRRLLMINADAATAPLRRRPVMEMRQMPVLPHCAPRRTGAIR